MGLAEAYLFVYNIAQLATYSFAAFAIAMDLADKGDWSRCFFVAHRFVGMWLDKGGWSGLIRIRCFVLNRLGFAHREFGFHFEVRELKYLKSR